MNNRIPSLMLAVFLLPIVAWVQAAPTTLPEAPTPALLSPCPNAYKTGLEALSREDLQAAHAAFEQCLKVEARHTDSMLGMAEVAFKRKDLVSARNWLDKARDLAPLDPNILASIGRAHALQGELTDAETVLLDAIRLSRTLVRARMDLADLYATALRKPEAAIALYEEVLTIEAEHAGALYALGTTQARSGRPEDASANLRRSAALAKNNPLPLLALAQLDASQGKLAQALEWAAQATQIDPKLAAANALQADLLAALSRPSEALAYYRRIPAASPSYGAAQLRIGMILQTQGDSASALQAYEAAISAEPDNPVAHNNLAWLLANQGHNLDAALASARKAVELQPANPDFLDTLAAVLRAREAPLVKQTD